MKGHSSWLTRAKWQPNLKTALKQNQRQQLQEINSKRDKLQPYLVNRIRFRRDWYLWTVTWPIKAFDTPHWWHFQTFELFGGIRDSNKSWAETVFHDKNANFGLSILPSCTLFQRQPNYSQYCQHSVEVIMIPIVSVTSDFSYWQVCSFTKNTETKRLTWVLLRIFMDWYGSVN